MRTITWWLWKYWCNRRAAVNSDRDIFSISWYLISVLCNTQLMKYTGRCSGFSCTRAALIVSSKIDRYSCKGSSSTGQIIIGVLLIITFFMILRIGLIFSFNLGRKRARDVRRPANRWIFLRFLGLLISVMAVHLSGLASIPRPVSMNHRNLPVGTPNTHFSGLRRMLYLRTWWKTSLRSRTWSLVVYDFTTMSSTYSSMVRPICPLKTRFISLL